MSYVKTTHYIETVRIQLAYTEGDASLILNLNSGLVIPGMHQGKNILRILESYQPFLYESPMPQTHSTRSPLRQKGHHWQKFPADLAGENEPSWGMGGVGSHKKTSHVKMWVNSTHRCFGGEKLPGTRSKRRVQGCKELQTWKRPEDERCCPINANVSCVDLRITFRCLPRVRASPCHRTESWKPWGNLAIKDESWKSLPYVFAQQVISMLLSLSHQQRTAHSPSQPQTCYLPPHTDHWKCSQGTSYLSINR